MSKFNRAVDDLVAQATSLETTPNELQAAAELVYTAISTADRAEFDDGLKRMAEHVAAADLAKAAIMAICCGAAVEKGGSADIAIPAVLCRLDEAMTLAQLFAEACEEIAADDDDRAPHDGEETDDDDPIQKFGAEVARVMPENAKAFNAVEPLGMGAIVMLSRSPVARMNVRKMHTRLADAAGDLAPYHQQAHFLEKMLNVLEEERVVVLHPAEKKGYRIVLRGVATNSELFILLADALIGEPAAGWLPGKKPDAAILAACQGRPTEGTRVKNWEPAFNFYNWPALKDDRTLPDPGDYQSSKDWIWMEGIPSDIEAFEGQRLVLLGPPSNARTFRPERCFEGMAADLRLEARLSFVEVEQWLRKLSSAAANRSALR